MEYIYILENESMPGLVKIGRTERAADDRAAELSASTGVPTKFRVYRTCTVRDAQATEAALHHRLAEYRVNGRREFFRISPELVIGIIESEFGASERNYSEEFEHEDELVAQAAELAKKNASIWPGMISGLLKIPHEEASRIYSILVARKLLDSDGKSYLFIPPPKPKRLPSASVEETIQSRPNNTSVITAPEPQKVSFSKVASHAFMIAMLGCLVIGIVGKNGAALVIGLILLFIYSVIR